MPYVKMGFLIPQDLNDSLNNLIPTGMKTRIIITALRLIEEDLRTNGKYALGQWLNANTVTLLKKLPKD
jgi:hypothetical protein